MQLGSNDPRSRITEEGTDRAVSPVIGVILMVAITVVLAGVIGVMVFGLTDDLGDTTPSSTLDITDIDVANDQFILEHNGGDDIAVEDLTILVAGSEVDPLDVASSNVSEGDEFSSGQSVTVGATLADGDTITVRHGPSNSVMTEAEAEA